ncbi:MAG TPA: hypothetical protein DCX07_03200 [Phycisphaerales bacterium]|nr:hypothetical protein [Phycisphaerales bacterium]
MKDHRVSLGNLFYMEEPVVLSVAQPCNRLTWRVANGWGVEVLTGEGAPNGSTQTICLPNPGAGLFYVDFVAEQDRERVGQWSTRFLVTTPFDLSAIEESPFAAMSHFAQGWPIEVASVLAKAGIKHTRDEVHWDGIERARGEFTFDRYDSYLSVLDRLHMPPLIVLAFGNRLYDAPEGVPMWCAAPYTENGFAGYARYAQAVLEHYGSQIRYVEVWNEYNGAFAKDPAAGRPEVYAEMLKHAYRAIKAIRPDVKVLGCSTIGIPLGWLEEVFRRDGLRHMDGIAIHPYGYLHPPEAKEKDLVALRELVLNYNDGKEMPVWVTEQGWYTFPAGARGNRRPITEHVQARYLVRGFTLFAAHGVEKSFWYHGCDDKAFPNIGLVCSHEDPRGAFAPKPALAAYATLIRQIARAEFVARDETDAGICSYRFRREGRDVRVMWSLRPIGVALASDAPLEVTDMMGAAQTVHPVNGHVHLCLSDAPMYVVGTVAGMARDESFSARVPEQSAVGGPLTVEFSLPRGAETISVRAGGQTAPDGARVVLPAAETEGERWIPLEIHAGERLVCTGTVKTYAEQPVSVDRFPRLTKLDTLEIRVRNHSATREARLEMVRCIMGGVEQERHVRQMIPAGGEAAMEFAIRNLRPFTIYPVKTEAILADGQTIRCEGATSFNPVARRTICVDGDLNDWDGIEGIDLSAAPFLRLMADHTGEADLSGDVRLAWDDENLYLAARIRDDVFCQPFIGFNVWMGDSIELGFSLEAPWVEGEWEQSTAQHLSLALTPKGPQCYRLGGVGRDGLVEDVRLVVRREGDVTFYECALPWRELDASAPRKGRFSLGLYVNDNDGSCRKGFKQWGDVHGLNKFQPLHLPKA